MVGMQVSGLGAIAAPMFGMKVGTAAFCVNCLRKVLEAYMFCSKVLIIQEMTLGGSLAEKIRILCLTTGS